MVHQSPGPNPLLALFDQPTMGWAYSPKSSSIHDLGPKYSSIQWFGLKAPSIQVFTSGVVSCDLTLTQVKIGDVSCHLTLRIQACHEFKSWIQVTSKQVRNFVLYPRLPNLPDRSKAGLKQEVQRGLSSAVTDLHSRIRMSNPSFHLPDVSDKGPRAQFNSRKKMYSRSTIIHAYMQVRTQVQIFQIKIHVTCKSNCLYMYEQDIKSLIELDQVR